MVFPAAPWMSRSACPTCRCFSPESQPLRILREDDRRTGAPLRQTSVRQALPANFRFRRRRVRLLQQQREACWIASLRPRRHLAEEHAREGFEKRIERSRIAAKTAANQVAIVGAVIVQTGHDRQRSIFRASVFLEVGKTTHARRRTQDIGVTHRVDDDIARIELLAGVGASRPSGPAGTGQDGVEADHMSSRPALPGEAMAVEGGDLPTHGAWRCRSKKMAPVKCTAFSTSERTSIAGVSPVSDDRARKADLRNIAGQSYE